MNCLYRCDHITCGAIADHCSNFTEQYRKNHQYAENNTVDAYTGNLIVESTCKKNTAPKPYVADFKFVQECTVHGWKVYTAGQSPTAQCTGVFTLVVYV